MLGQNCVKGKSKNYYSKSKGLKEVCDSHGLIEEVTLELFSERCTRGMQDGRLRLERTVKEEVHM